MEMEVDAEQLSPTSYAHNLQHIKTLSKISMSRMNIMRNCLDDLKLSSPKKIQKLVACKSKKHKKDIRIKAQQRDFQTQLIMEQTACQQVSNT